MLNENLTIAMPMFIAAIPQMRDNVVQRSTADATNNNPPLYACSHASRLLQRSCCTAIARTTPQPELPGMLAALGQGEASQALEGCQSLACLKSKI